MVLGSYTHCLAESECDYSCATTSGVHQEGADCHSPDGCATTGAAQDRETALQEKAWRPTAAISDCMEDETSPNTDTRARATLRTREDQRTTPGRGSGMGAARTFRPAAHGKSGTALLTRPTRPTPTPGPTTVLGHLARSTFNAAATRELRRQLKGAYGQGRSWPSCLCGRSRELRSGSLRLFMLPYAPLNSGALSGPFRRCVTTREARLPWGTKKQFRRALLCRLYRFPSESMPAKAFSVREGVLHGSGREVVQLAGRAVMELILRVPRHKGLCGGQTYGRGPKAGRMGCSRRVQMRPTCLSTSASRPSRDRLSRAVLLLSPGSVTTSLSSVCCQGPLVLSSRPWGARTLGHSPALAPGSRVHSLCRHELDGHHELG